MFALHIATGSHFSLTAFRRFGKLMCLCAGLLAMATVNASTHISVIDSFDAIDDRLRTTPRTVPAPGTDFTQINSLNGSVVADRLIILSNGNLALTGSALEMFGDSLATITITYGTEVEWTAGGASAFDFHFSLSDGTVVEVAASVTTATGVVDYLPLSFAEDGEHRAYFNFDLNGPADFSRVNSFSFDVVTFDGLETFSLDAVGTTVAVIPVLPAVWLFGSALGLLGWIRRTST